MNIILFLVALVPRPPIVPVGQAELSAALKIEAAAAVTASAVRSDTGLSAWNSPLASRVPGRYVVGFEPGAVTAAREWVSQHGGSLVRVDSASGFVVADFAEGDGSQLVASASQTGGIRYFEPDLKVHAASLPNDPDFIPFQWDKWVMYADEAWDITGGNMDVIVAVVDNGVDYTHPDLAGDFKPGDLGYDFVENDNDPRPRIDSLDAFHGTHVAGIIAATRNNDIGIAGWSLVQLLAVRVLNDSGSGTVDDVASGITWAVNNGARIINMSLTSTSPSTTLENACAYAAQQGVLLFAASGNDGNEAIGYPAAYSQCIAVGAISLDSRLSSYSNWGAEQELVAPGDSILSTVPGGGYGWAWGTSMATPQTSGVAALLLAENWGLNATQVRAILDASAIDMGVAGRDVQYGYGLVNAKRALDLAAMYTANRAPRGLSPHCPTGASEANGDCPQVSGVVIVRAGAGLPTWIAQADVYDGSGRRVQTGESGLRPGAYFVRSVSESKVQSPGSTGTRRLLVLD